jgi:hypothetical protein
MPNMVPEFTINGSFGEVRDANGKWLSQCQEVSARVTVDRQDIQMSGTRRTGYKAMRVTGEGNLRMFKVTSEYLALVAEMMQSDLQIQYVGQLLVVLKDPEAIGYERVLLKGVKFWEVPIGFRVNEIVEEDIPFTFFTLKPLDKIEGDVTLPLDRYAALSE